MTLLPVDLPDPRRLSASAPESELSDSLNAGRHACVVIVDHLQAQYASDHYLSQGKEMLCHRSGCHV